MSIVPPKHFRACLFGAGHRGVYLPRERRRIIMRNDCISPAWEVPISMACALAHCHEQKFPILENLSNFESYLMGRWIGGSIGRAWTHHQQIRQLFRDSWRASASRLGFIRLKNLLLFNRSMLLSVDCGIKDLAMCLIDPSTKRSTNGTSRVSRLNTLTASSRVWSNT